MTEKRVVNLCCGHAACQRQVAEAMARHKEYEKLYAQAEILFLIALWTEQPEEPTGTYGWISSSDLRTRAIALQTEADVFYK